MFPPLMKGPIALYNNVPIEPQFYQPSQFFISAITLGQTTIVTTSVNNNYVIGQLCRLLVPNGWGSTSLNEQTGIVISLPASNQVELNINSMGVNPFINIGFPTKPQIIAVGDYNSGSINANGRAPTATFISGSFENISPL